MKSYFLFLIESVTKLIWFIPPQTTAAKKPTNWTIFLLIFDSQDNYGVSLSLSVRFIICLKHITIMRPYLQSPVFSCNQQQNNCRLHSQSSALTICLLLRVSFIIQFKKFASVMHKQVMDQWSLILLFSSMFPILSMSLLLKMSSTAWKNGPQKK